MKKNSLTIILMVVAVLLLAGSFFLYRNLANNTGGTPSEAVPVVTASVPTPAPVKEDTTTVDNTPVPAETPTPVTATESPYPPATDFVFTDQSGKEYHLSDFYGKPIVINFFATWCPPCRGELPYFDDAYLKYQDQVTFLVIDLVDDGSESVQNGLDFASSNAYHFPLYFDTRGEGYGAYGSGYIPVTVVITADGRLFENHTGGLSQEELLSLINGVING